MYNRNALIMSSRRIVISGTGCALADFLYKGISFSSSPFLKYNSARAGDGGLSPGQLVFTEELEKFSGKSYSEILVELTGGRKPDAFNVGGPSLVSLIHASQMLDDNFRVRFYGIAGSDSIAEKVFDSVRATPLGIDNYVVSPSRATPSTDVLSDPDYDGGHGERTFINNIGAAWDYSPADLDDSFFDSHIVCFGGTALVPRIHDDLSSLLIRSKEKDCITIVNTVFDFRNEKNRPGAGWPLVCRDEDYRKIDILIMDFEEALKISGQNNIDEAILYFESVEVNTFIITNGAGDIYARSAGSLFEKTDLLRLPVSEEVIGILKSSPWLKGDTTGCGDNFAGGIIASLARQIREKKKGRIDLTESISWGVASGGFTCFITGGTFRENQPGEKRTKVADLQEKYIKQII